MGFASPISTHARTTRHSFCDISASPRCTALKSSSALPLLPLGTELAAPPPIPMRYAGPPTLTTSIPTSGGFFLWCARSIWPKPPENMMGLIHSRRSPLGSRAPYARV